MRIRFGKSQCALSLLLLFDAVQGYRLYDLGWPSRLVISGDPRHAAHIQVIKDPLAASDWFFILAFVGLHGFLIYLVWKSWRSGGSNAGESRGSVGYEG